MTKLIVDGHEMWSIAGNAACLAAALVWLSPSAAAAGDEFPTQLAGIWTKEKDAPAANPAGVTLAAGTIAFDGKRCRLDRMRAIHARRWYADLTCPDGPVWLDVNLLSENRMMLNRRPMHEAEIYVRAPEPAPEDGNR
jgi:hypothetical protein